MRTSDVVIRHPERVSRARRGAYGALTVGAWVVFAWLFQPLITLLVWALGGWITYQEVVRQAGAVEPLVILAIGILAVIAGTALVAWAEYNHQRFAGTRRRTGSRPSRPSDHAGDLELSGDMRGRLNRARVAVVRFDEDGMPQDVGVLAP